MEEGGVQNSYYHWFIMNVTHSCLTSLEPAMELDSLWQASKNDVLEARKEGT